MRRLGLLIVEHLGRLLPLSDRAELPSVGWLTLPRQGRRPWRLQRATHSAKLSLQAI